MKLWAILWRTTKDRWVMVESAEKTWSTEEGNSKQFQHSCLENTMNSMKRPKKKKRERERETLKNELSRSVSTQYATGEEWRNSSRENKETEPKWKKYSVVDVTGDGNEVQCCNGQYCIGNWNVRPMNQVTSKCWNFPGDGKSEHRHYRNKWTKMYWNEWI